MDAKRSQFDLPQKAYLRLLRLYKIKPENHLFRQGFEAFVRIFVILERQRQGVKFPERVVKEWWWIWRWRFEYLLGWYEYPTLQLCSRLIRPGMVVLDIGAHIGYYTWHFSKYVGQSGKVIAFEPCPENLPLLRHNLHAKRCRNTHAEGAAVTEKPGRVELYLSPGNSNHSLIESFTETVGQVSVESTSIDAYLAKWGNPVIGLAKIDVEGSEPLVLEGMMKTIERSPSIALMVELNFRALEAGGFVPEDLVHMLADMGFNISHIQEDGLIRPIDKSVFSTKQTCNLICHPDETLKVID